MTRGMSGNSVTVVAVLALACLMITGPLMAGVVVADQHGNETTATATPTPTPTPEPEPSGSDGGADVDGQAELAIHQPRHVTSQVEDTTENGSRVYVARGQHLEIEPENFNPDDVTAYAVREDEARLTYDSAINRWVLDTQRNAGTYHVQFTVSRDSETVVLTASIRVVEADYAHVPRTDLKEIREQNDEYAGYIRSIEQSGDPDDTLQEKVEFGNQVRDFKHAPFAALRGQFLGLQTMRFLTPAGWLDLGITLILVYVLTRGLYTTIARLRKQLEREEKVGRREDVQYMKMYKQILAGKPLTDVSALDDHQAAVMEQRLGPNLYTATRNFWDVWGTDSLKRMYTDAMGAVGYTARVTRDATGSITDISVYDPEDREPMADGGEPSEGELETSDGFVNLSNVPTDVLDALEWDQVDQRVFQRNPDISAVDHLMVANRERDGDLISELKFSIPEDFQSRRECMEAIGHFIQEVQQTEFTDEQNIPREERAVLNNLMVFTSIMEDQYDIPLDLYWRAAVWNAEGLDRDDEARSVLDDIQDTDPLSEDLDIQDHTDQDRDDGGDGVAS